MGRVRGGVAVVGGEKGSGIAAVRRKSGGREGGREGHREREASGWGGASGWESSWGEAR